MPAEEEPAPMERRDNESPLQLCVKWNNYQANLMSSFEQLLKNQSFVDVTLACDGQSLKAHKVVLSACSPYFETLFMDNPCRHPIIIMRDIKFADLQAIVDFMYRGEINISQEQLTSFLKVAETLKVRGLTDVTEDYSVSSSGIRRRPSKRRPSDAESPPRARRRVSLDQSPGRSPPRAPSTPPRAATTEPLPPPENSHPPLPPLHPDDVDIRPGIAEMIREEERVLCALNFFAQGSYQTPIGEHLTMNMSQSSVSRCIAEVVEALNHPSVFENWVHFPDSFQKLNEIARDFYNTYGFPGVIGCIDCTHVAIVPPTSSYFDERSYVNRKNYHSINTQLAKLKHNRAWLGSPLPSTSSLAADSYQYQLQSMYQNCWTTNQGLVHNLRFRERGPLKSWRPETMAEAIISVLKEGLSLSQAARKYDIPYPTFVLYANRVHNMLGPSADGGADLRPKGRGRPQRILLGVWPDNTIREVIRAVVFRDMNAPLSHRRDDVLPYPALTDGTSDAHAPCGNGRDEGVPVSAATATAAAVAAVAYSLRHQMVGAAQRPPDHPHLGLPSLPLQSPCLFSPISEGLESPLCSPPPPGHALEPPRERFHHPFVTSTQIQGSEMGPPKAPLAKNGKDGMSTPVSVTAESPPVDSPSPKIF